ncbi:MAG TPA: tetratricopeptide repeat protein [Ktedonobacterales bacterium]|nr:tetratricopeptide repeat protein [Ktedonobacterales bacterium]
MIDGSSLPDFDALWDYARPAETEVAFRALLPEAQAQASRNLSYYLELLTQIARTQGLQRDFAAAHQTLDAVQAQLIDDLCRASVRYLLERGRVFNSSGQPEEGRPLFEAAWEQARACHEDLYAIDAAHMVAIVAPPDEKLAWNRKGLEVVEQTTDTRAQPWGGSLYNNIGWGYHAQGQYILALEAFSKALEWRKIQGDPREILIAKWCIARTLRSNCRVEEALRQQQALQEAWKPLGGSDGYTEEELGECLLVLDRLDEARPYFAQAYAKLSQDAWLMATEPARIERLKRLSEGQ